ncbi:efflux RND transporter periplasmic adaptor subunit [Gimesia panareensis]|uniref:efflux RND transporter periplasmic adaptor subunit n=1 Tax=Gimesia panareensis TaxID=2527978 RepID=UPI00118AD452|nr:efflux RND transporter periplasmic adaptor subunit [Gimesia panareensis]QDU49489.1 Macrolide export protein MacA [Gimesia panareensis]
MNLLKETPVFLIGCLLTGVIFLLWSPEQKAPSESHSAKSKHGHGSEHSQTSKTLSEADLNVITLSPTAVKRLGIETAPVEVREMPRTRAYGAEMVLPTGAAVIVSAPLAGTLRHPQGHPFPQVGQQVKQEETILELLPLLSPERAVLTPAERIRFAEAKAAVAQSQIDAEGQLQQAVVQQDAARIQLERAKRLLDNSVGTKRAVDDAEAKLKLAEEVLAAAKNRKKLVDHIQLDEAAGTLKPMPIRAPLSGIVRTTSVQPGQVIAAGAPLFEVMNGEKLWVKVPVYAGELDEIDATKPVRITLLDGHFTQQDVMGKPVSLPPTALPLSAAVDLYYEIDNQNHRYRPGQKVSVNVPLTGKSYVKSVPWSALIYDVYGGQWVYERLGEQTFARRRVEAGWVNQDRIALLRGPEAGTKIVTAGAAELMGTEFGFAK